MTRPHSILAAALSLACLAGIVFCADRLARLDERLAALEKRPAAAEAPPRPEPAGDDAELARLRAEVEELKARPAAEPAAPLDGDAIERAIQEAVERDRRRREDHLEALGVAATLERTLPRLTAALNLSAEQIRVVGEELERATREEIRLLSRARTEKELAEAEGKCGEVRRQRDAAVKARLTLEQAPKYDAFLKDEGLEPVVVRDEE